MLAGGAILAFTGGHVLASLWISVGIGLFTQGLFGLPEFQSGIEQNVTGTQVALPVVYGEAIVGHAVADVRMAGDENEYMHAVGALCVASENGEGIESIDEIYFGNDLAIDLSGGIAAPSVFGSTTGVEGFWFRDAASLVRYNLHLGADNQTVDPLLNNVFPAEWPASSVGLNITYAVLRLEWDDSEERRFSGIPQVTYKIKGNRLYDPRFPTNGPDGDGYCWDAADSDTSLQASTNGYADLHPGKNPALGLYDYLKSVKYGLAVPTARIDTQSFIDHANYCDDEVTLTGVTGTPSQPRYQINGVISTGDDHKTNIEKFLSAMNANLVWGQGKIFLMPRKPQTAETFELTGDNILGQISVTRSGMATPNTIRARFPDEDNDYNIMDVVWPEPGTNDYLTADNGWESEHLIDLPLTTNYYTAQHLAMIALRELREDVTIELEATEAALVLQPGHIVKVTYDTAGWTQKEFRVITMNLTEQSTINFQLREYDVGVYSLDAQNDKPTVPGTDLPNPFVVQPPTNVGVTCNVPIETTYGEVIPGVEVTWTHSIDPFAEWEEPVYKEFTAVDWIHTGRRVLMADDAEALLSGPFEVGKTYHFAVLAYNHLGRASSYAVGPSCQIQQPEDPGSPVAGSDIIPNCEWADSGSYWATKTGSTGVATTTTTISTGVDFVFDNNGEFITLVVVVDDDTDITKTISF